MKNWRKPPSAATPEQDRHAERLSEALRPRTSAEQAVARRLARLGGLILRSGRLWHTTSPGRFCGILEARAILPEPPIPDWERWGTAEGPDFYPLVRSFGGVSLFDFRAFPGWEAYERDYPMSSLRSFVPVRDGWDSAVWIEIDRGAVAARLITAEALRSRRADDPAAKRRKWMPLIEAAHEGPLPVGAFRRAFAIARADGAVLRLAY